MHVQASDRTHRAAALDLLFAELPPHEREAHVADLIAAAATEALSLDGLLVAIDQGTIAGAALYVLRSDRTAFVWPPVARELAERQSVCTVLLEDIGRRIDAVGARLGQCVLECDRQAERDILVRSGFAHVADLVFLERPLSDPVPVKPDAFTSVVTFDANVNADRFARLLERTYVATLDCPLFSGRLTGREALDGHALAGEFDPELWRLFQVDGADVAVLLVNEHADRNAREVVYMGVAPEFRGKGYGRAMLLGGLLEAQRGGLDSMTLACDRANRYALNMYGALGFVETARRSVHVRFPSAQTIAK